MPSDAKFSPSFHEVRPAMVPLHSFLPNSFSDFERIGVREGDRADRLQLKNDADEGERRGESPSLTELLPLLVFS